ncbi:MAG: cobalamin biosynthesis protein CbiX [Verrucomicrobia bacterium]|nr:MAG: cobalamin biosynthesis protein CbiX [Verrucomicrobiota bacterium]
MNREIFSDATLVVLGHGTTLNENSALPVRQHAAELRRRGIFAEVREAFWKQEPQVKQVLAEIKSPRVFIVPLFISEGYFASEVIPRELGFAGCPATLNSQLSTLNYCSPVGTHERMTDVILARAREVVEKFPFPRAPKPKDITLFIAGHGTERNEKSRRSIERQVELIRGKQIYADVHAVFMEEDPRIAEVYSLATTRNVVVVPFFISDGLHVVEDIPVLLGEPERIVKERHAHGQPTWRNPSEKHDKLVWYSPAVGSEPLMADVILERVREAATRLASAPAKSQSVT